MYMAIYFPIKMQQHLILKVADFIFQKPPPKQKERKKKEPLHPFLFETIRISLWLVWSNFLLKENFVKLWKLWFLS